MFYAYWITLIIYGDDLSFRPDIRLDIHHHTQVADMVWPKSGNPTASLV